MAGRVGLVAVLATVLLVGAYAGITRVHEPSAPAAAVATPRGLVVHATGDVLLDLRQLGATPASPWTGVRGLFGADDVTIVNLECAPGDGGVREEKEFAFRCSDPAAHAAMRAAGVDVANVGNNHSYDFGLPAFLDGLRRLGSAGLRTVGGGRNEAEATTPAVFERGGKTIAVLGFSRVVPTVKWKALGARGGVTDGYSIPSIVRAVRVASAAADYVFVAIHWGDEGKREPLDEDVERAHALVDAGADAVFGHHAHVLQPLEFYKGRPIFYGLGNFVWPGFARTAIAQVRISPQSSIRACLLPARIVGGRPVPDRARC